jgi:hypothetical protein
MNIFWVSKGKPVGGTYPKKRRRPFQKPTQYFVVRWLEYLQRLQDMHLCYKTTKEMWDTLNTEYGGSDIGTEMYIIEQYHDYQMVDGKIVVTQAHEIQFMVKELTLLKIIVPGEFVAGDIIVKLSPS